MTDTPIAEDMGEVPFELLQVLDRPNDLWEVCWKLLRIGYDLPKVWLAGDMVAWRNAGTPIDLLAQGTVHDLRSPMEGKRDLFVLDARQLAEWRAPVRELP